MNLKPITGLDGYWISDEGHAYRSVNDEASPLLRISPKKTKRGYLYIVVYQNKKKFSFYLHRLVLEHFIGSCPEGMEACHHPDRDPGNNHIDNLAWVTHKENEAQKKIHGTDPSGERNGMSKLTEKQVRQIKKMYQKGVVGYTKVAEKFNTSRMSVKRIIKGITWKSVI